MRKLFKFSWDCYRMGVVEGVFIATQREIDDAIGKEVYFGGILGKHSEVYGTLEEGQVKEITSSQEVVKVVEEFGLSSGYNPLCYIEEKEE